MVNYEECFTPCRLKDSSKTGLDQHCETPQNGMPVHGDGLSADARLASLPPFQRIQDLHRPRGGSSSCGLGQSASMASRPSR